MFWGCSNYVYALLKDIISDKNEACLFSFYWLFQESFDYLRTLANDVHVVKGDLDEVNKLSNRSYPLALLNYICTKLAYFLLESITNSRKVR